jgi:hypothetical protein
MFVVVREIVEDRVVYRDEVRRNIEDNRMLLFTLVAHEWDFKEDSPERHYSCVIKEYDENGALAEEYWKGFPFECFDRDEYMRFVDEFCDCFEMRDKYNLRHHFVTRRFNDGSIDERLRDLLFDLNDMGIKTDFSCQGTDAEWTDYPCPVDAHSVTAYIQTNSIPEELREKLKNDERIKFSAARIMSTKREYNAVFADIIMEAIKQL